MISDFNNFYETKKSTLFLKFAHFKGLIKNNLNIFNFNFLLLMKIYWLRNEILQTSFEFYGENFDVFSKTNMFKFYRAAYCLSFVVFCCSFSTNVLNKISMLYIYLSNILSLYCPFHQIKILYTVNYFKEINILHTKVIKAIKVLQNLIP